MAHYTFNPVYIPYKQIFFLVNISLQAYKSIKIHKRLFIKELKLLQQIISRKY